MSRSRESAIYEGELFFGEPKLKTWDPVCSGNVSVSLLAGTLYAFQGDEKVWEYKVEPSLKCRVKDTFVQWQIKGPEGPLSYGMRLKTAEIAQKFLDAMTAALTNVLSKPVPEQQTVLKVILPGKETTTISAPKSMTMADLFKLITQRRHLDPLQYTLALPPDSAHALGALCQPQSVVGSLKSAEVHVVRKPSQPGDGAGASQSAAGVSLKGGEVHAAKKAPQSAPDGGAVGSRPSYLDGAGSGGAGGSEQTIMLQVELPKGDKMSVRVNANELLPEVLKCLCEMRDMDPEEYMFDLPPATSIASKTLLQLDTNRVKIVPRAADKDNRKGPSGSPVLGRKSGPPPPPPGGNTKKVQPPPPPPEQQEPVGRRGRSGSLDSPLLSRKAVAAPLAPTGNRKVQPQLVKELTLKLQRGNTLVMDTDEVDDGDQPPEVPFIDDLEIADDQFGGGAAPKPQGQRLALPPAGKGISASVSVDGLSDEASKGKKQGWGADVDGLEAPSSRTLMLKGQLDEENLADGLRRQAEGQGRYRSIKKKPVKIPEGSNQAKPSDAGQVGEGVKLEAGQVVGSTTRQPANPGLAGDSWKQEVGTGQVGGDPSKLQANLGQVQDSVKQPVKVAAVESASVQSQVRQPGRQESFKQGAKAPVDAKRPRAQESSEQPISRMQGEQSDVSQDKEGGKYSSLKRKPRTNAPPPPVSSEKLSSVPPLQPQQKAGVASEQPKQGAVVTQPQVDQQKSAVPTAPASEKTSRKAPAQQQVGQQRSEAAPIAPASEKTVHRVPARPAPARPAPARPAPAPPKQQQNVSKQPAATTPLTNPTPEGMPRDSKAPVQKAALSTAGSSEAPAGTSPRSLRRGGTVVSAFAREDGGKVLIVRQSPVLGRRGSLPDEVVFNFPPPPSSFRDEDLPLAPGVRGKDDLLVSPSKSDTSGDERVLSPTRTDTSVEITNLDDVMSADEGDGGTAALVASAAGKGAQSGAQLGGGEAVKDEKKKASVPEVADHYPDVVLPSALDDGGGASADELAPPPPPSDFEFMPPEPAFDLGSGNEGDGDEEGGIVLLSVKPNHLLDIDSVIPPPDTHLASFSLHKADDVADLSLPPPPGHGFETPSPPLTPPIMSAPPPPLFGTLPTDSVPPPHPPFSVASLLAAKASSSSMITTSPPSLTSIPPHSQPVKGPSFPVKAPTSSTTTSASSSHPPLTSVPPPPQPTSVVKGPSSLSNISTTSSGYSSIPAHPPPPPFLVMGSSSVSVTAPVSSVTNSTYPPSNSLPLSSTRFLTSTDHAPTPPVVPPSFVRYPTPPPLPTNFPTPPPPVIPPPPAGYPTPPPLRAFDISTLNAGHFDYIPPPVDSPLDSPALVPPPVDSPLDSPSLYQTSSLTLLEPPSIPEPGHSELPLPDHFSSVPLLPPPTPPSSSPPQSPSLNGSSPVPHPPPLPPVSLGSKPFAPLVKPKPPAAARLRQMGATFSETDDFTHSGHLTKHPLSVKAKAPPVARWRSLDKDGEAELLSKLQERKAKLKDVAAPDASGAQSVAAPPGGDSMQVQLQMLQQQVLQQQMMQLQHQFQQLQMANMGYGAPHMAGMNLGMYQQAVGGGANPSLFPMAMGGQPPQGMPFPVGYIPQSSGLGPTAAMPLGMQPFGMVGIHSQPAPSTLSGAVPGYPVMTPGVTPLPPMSSAGTSGSLSRRMSKDELARSAKLGVLEDKFDHLMNEVRETDPSQVLKKVPEEKKDKESSSPYTGMAAALHDALKLRRVHLTEKAGTVEHDVQEWESSP